MDPHIEKRFENQTKSKTFNNLIKAYNLNEKKVFDIGCSYGEFLIHFGKGSSGITIQHSELNYGIAKGLNIVKGNIEEKLEIKEKYDVVFANNILEHLKSPFYFLYNAKNYLAKDGIIIVGVPCVPNIKPLLKINKFWGSMAKEHMNFFTKFTLAMTVERAGWEILDVRGFHIKNKYIDQMLNPVYPHFYVVAKPNESKLVKLEY